LSEWFESLLQYYVCIGKGKNRHNWDTNGSRSQKILYSVTISHRNYNIGFVVGGGMIGLVLVFGGAALASHVTEIDITLTYSNILLGINVLAIVGLIAGFVPAWSASRFNPVVAIRTNA